MTITYSVDECCIGKKTPILVSSDIGGLPQLDSPSPLNAFSIDTTSNFIYYPAVPGDYVLQRSTNPDFSNAAEIYRGANLSYTDSGLSPDTTYYYRVKAIKSGFSDSNWATQYVYTYFNPVAWYEFTGLLFGTTNSYGSVNSGTSTIASFNSVINTSGPQATATFGTHLIFNRLLYPSIGTVSNGMFALGSDITLSGDFDVCCRFAFGTVPGANRYLMTNNADTTYIILGPTSAIMNINGTSKTINYPSTPNTIQVFDFVFRRTGTTYKISMDGGDTFAEGTGGSSANFVINRLFNRSDASHGVGPVLQIERIVFASGNLNSNQLDKVFNPFKSQDYISSAKTQNIEVKGLTFYDLPQNGFLNHTSSNAPWGAKIRDRVFTQGNKTFMLNEVISDAQGISGQLVCYDHSTNKVSQPQNIAYYMANTDDHNRRSMAIYDNRIIIFMHNIHYGLTTNTTLKIKYSNPNFDFSALSVQSPNSQTTGFNEKILGNNVASHVETFCNYHSLQRLGNDTIFIFNQEFQNFARWITCLKTTDFFSSFEKIRICDTVEATNWFYYKSVYDGSASKLRLFINYYENVDGGADPGYRQVMYLESSDGYTWSNKEGDFSQNVKTAGPITLTQLRDECMVFDGNAAGNDAEPSINDGVAQVWCKEGYVAQDGSVYGIFGNGNTASTNNRNTLIYWDGAAWQKKIVDYGGKPVVEFSDSAIVKVGASSYDVYVNEIIEGGANDGKIRIVRFTTTNNGDNWDSGTVVSPDDSISVFVFGMNYNHEWVNHKVLTGFTDYRNVTTGKAWIKIL